MCLPVVDASPPPAYRTALPDDRQGVSELRNPIRASTEPVSATTSHDPRSSPRMARRISTSAWVFVEVLQTCEIFSRGRQATRHGRRSGCARDHEVWYFYICLGSVTLTAKPVDRTCCRCARHPRGFELTGASEDVSLRRVSVAAGSAASKSEGS